MVGVRLTGNVDSAFGVTDDANTEVLISFRKLIAVPVLLTLSTNSFAQDRIDPIVNNGEEPIREVTDRTVPNHGWDDDIFLHITAGSSSVHATGSVVLEMSVTDARGSDLDNITFSSGGWDDDIFLRVHNSDGDADPHSDLFLLMSAVDGRGSDLDNITFSSGGWDDDTFLIINPDNDYGAGNDTDDEGNTLDTPHGPGRSGGWDDDIFLMVESTDINGTALGEITFGSGGGWDDDIFLRIDNGHGTGAEANAPVRGNGANNEAAVAIDTSGGDELNVHSGRLRRAAPRSTVKPHLDITKHAN